jgi:hypothetical protein
MLGVARMAAPTPWPAGAFSTDMAKVHAALQALNRGEVSRSALARVDVERMRLAAECQVNWRPTVIGDMSLRPGLKYLFPTRSSAACVPIPFVFGADDTAILELTDSHLRVIVDDALVTRPSVSTSVTNGDFSSGTGWTLTTTADCTANINSTVAGQLYLQANARGGSASALRSVSVAGGDQNVLHALRIEVTFGPVTFMCGSTSGGSEYIGPVVLETGTHSLAFTPTGGTFYVKFETTLQRYCQVDSITVESSGTFDIGTPWAAADLSKIRYDQSGDVVFIACEDYQQRKIERRDNNSWSVVFYRTDDGPFSFADTNRVSLTSNVFEGSGTLTASAPIFKSTDVGRLVRIFTAGQTNQATLGAVDAVTEAIRIAGVGVGDRGFNWVLIDGTTAFVGTVALERSVEGEDTGFKEVATKTGADISGVAASFAVDDTTQYDNVVAWYRIRIKAYTSGTVTASFTGTTVGSGPFGTGGASVSSSSISGRAGIARIVGFTSETSVGIEVVKPLSSLDASSNWQFGDWGGEDGWPTAVAFHESRLWWFRGDRRWASESDDYYAFDYEGVGDAATISRTFGQGAIQRINWGLSLGRLVIGREMSIDPVRSNSQEDVLTPANNTTKSCSTKGAAALPALKVGTRGVYVERSGRRVYGLIPDAQAGDYRAVDLTRLNLDIGIPGFVSLATQEQPDTLLHLVRSNGQVATLLYEPDDEVECWHRLMTLGVIENVVVLPGSIEDDVYFVVKRTINSSTVRYWEKQARRSECVGATLSRNLDSFIEISQASGTQVTGLSHLEGATVCVWANGKDLGTYTVASGQIEVSEGVATAIVGLGGVTASYDSSSASATLSVGTAYNGYPAEVFANGPQGGRLTYVGTVAVASGLVTLPNGRTAKKITAYLGFYAPFRSAKLAYGAQMGTALNQNKKVEKVGVILFDTHYQGLQYGSEIDNLQPLPLVAGGQDISSDTVFGEHEEPMVGLSGSWTPDTRLHLLAQGPRPANVAGVVVSVQTNEAR